VTRQDKHLIVIVGLGVLGSLAWCGAVGYVVAHFAMKYW
jgi:hypothetical protein